MVHNIFSKWSRMNDAFNIIRVIVVNAHHQTMIFIYHIHTHTHTHTHIYIYIWHNGPQLWRNETKLAFQSSQHYIPVQLCPITAWTHYYATALVIYSSITYTNVNQDVRCSVWEWLAVDEDFKDSTPKLYKHNDNVVRPRGCVNHIFESCVKCPQNNSSCRSHSDRTTADENTQAQNAIALTSLASQGNYCGMANTTPRPVLKKFNRKVRWKFAAYGVWSLQCWNCFNTLSPKRNGHNLPDGIWGYIKVHWKSVFA